MVRSRVRSYPMTETRTWKLWRWLLLALCPLALGYFVVFFKEPEFQPTVDLAWLIAWLCWLVALWRRETPRVPRLSHPWWFYALYLAALLPFAKNWRWAMVADTMSWPLGGIRLAEHGPPRTILTVNGADNFGYLQMALHDTFMLLISPTLFWHRCGQIMVSVLAIAAVYTVFTRLVAPRFALLVAGCAATTSVWLVYTFASYPFIDGLASAYALLAIALWVEREPDSRRAWLLLGLLSGFMLFLTPNCWFMAFCVWLFIGFRFLTRRWDWRLLAMAIVMGALIGLPMPIQWAQGQGGQLFNLVGNPGWTREKVSSFLQQAAYIPFASELKSAGAFGPQLPIGFRWLFIVGILLTPWFPRWFPGASFIVWIYAIQVVILAFAQGPYAAVSVKRALMLIPMATYFAFLPFHRFLRSLPVVLPIIAVWASFGVYDLVTKMEPGRTGYTLIDGVIEADQRFGEQGLCVVLNNSAMLEQFGPGSDAQRLYEYVHTEFVTRPDDPACAHVLCYSPQIDQIDLAALGYQPLSLSNTVELRCGRRRTAPPID